jgi:hypothetical protein
LTFLCTGSHTLGAVVIEVLYVPACPNVRRARERLRSALKATGVVATIRETEVSTPADAARIGMHGSPTILIDRRDPFHQEGEEASLSCRFYDVGGSIEGAPSVEQLVKVLQGMDRVP